MTQAYQQLEDRILSYLLAKNKPLTTSEIASGISESGNVLMVHTALGCLNREKRVLRVNWDGFPYWVVAT